MMIMMIMIIIIIIIMKNAQPAGAFHAALVMRARLARKRRRSNPPT